MEQKKVFAVIVVLLTGFLVISQRGLLQQNHPLPTGYQVATAEDCPGSFSFLPKICSASVPWGKHVNPWEEPLKVIPTQEEACDKASADCLDCRNKELGGQAAWVQSCDRHCLNNDPPCRSHLSLEEISGDCDKPYVSDRLTEYGSYPEWNRRRTQGICTAELRFSATCSCIPRVW